LCRRKGYQGGGRRHGQRKIAACQVSSISVLAPGVSTPEYIALVSQVRPNSIAKQTLTFPGMPLGVVSVTPRDCASVGPWPYAVPGGWGRSGHPLADRAARPERRQCAGRRARWLVEDSRSVMERVRSRVRPDRESSTRPPMTFATTSARWCFLFRLFTCFKFQHLAKRGLRALNPRGKDRLLRSQWRQ
jgi:hypothetical protein